MALGRFPTRPALLLALSLLAAGCGGAVRVPVVELPAAADLSVPVVLVPGVTGSVLRDRETGKVAWGIGRRVVSPHDGGYALARPLDTTRASRLEAEAVLERVCLAGKCREVYAPIVRLLEQVGYRRGDLDNPGVDHNLFLFAYDWRRDNVRSARLLYDRLEALRQVRAERRLRVALICQSNGAHICRWLAKYGDASLEEAEAGRGEPPVTLEITRMILVGTSNGGSLRVLRELDRGRRYLALIGRKIEPETLFTFPSLYQDLPSYLGDVFLDSTGRPLAGDLYDAETWRRYGLSVFGRKTRRRLERRHRQDLFADEAARFAFLAEQLDRARRFQRLLRRDVRDFGDPRYYLIQNIYDETPERAVLVRENGSWRALFSGDPELDKLVASRAAAGAPGDGHATRASQLWLSPQETAALRSSFHVRGDHFELILDPESLRRLAEYLHDD